MIDGRIVANPRCSQELWRAGALDGAEVSITDDVKVGFVGRNGAGKSTLLKILIGEDELDRGEVIRHPKLRLGYLRQHDSFLPGETVLDFLMRDSGQPDWKCGEVAAQFELKGAYLEGPIKMLSGGWQTRVKLAALLLHSPNLLLLDEPTNFLDLRTQILLEHFLRNFDEACLIVSHDRAFLGATCDHTLDLSRGKLTMFAGKIDEYQENQKERRKHDERVNAGVLAKKKHLEEFIAKNKARASTATRAKSREKQLEKLELVEIAADEPTVSIRAPVVEARRGPALRCIDVAIGYPERQIAPTSWPKSSTARVPRSSATMVRGRPPSCAPSSTRSSRSREKFAGGTAATSESTPSTFTRACRRTRRCFSTSRTSHPAGPRSRRS